VTDPNRNPGSFPELLCLSRRRQQRLAVAEEDEAAVVAVADAVVVAVQPLPQVLRAALPRLEPRRPQPVRVAVHPRVRLEHAGVAEPVLAAEAAEVEVAVERLRLRLRPPFSWWISAWRAVWICRHGEG
jgi:hypothetical protein